MKNILIVFLIFVNSFLFAQNVEKSTFFTSSEFGIYGGLNFNTLSHIYGSFYFEGRTNLTSNINLKLSAGYYKIFSFESYTVDSYEYVHIGDYSKYNTITYNVLRTEYQVIPISIGAQYNFIHNISTYYAFFDVSYNFIDPLTYQTPAVTTGEYNSISDIPGKYKIESNLPNNSYGLAFGAGAMYKLFSSFSIDIRYLFKYDSEIVNTHQLLIGFVF